MCVGRRWEGKDMWWWNEERNEAFARKKDAYNVGIVLKRISGGIKA